MMMTPADEGILAARADARATALITEYLGEYRRAEEVGSAVTLNPRGDDVYEVAADGFGLFVVDLRDRTVVPQACENCLNEEATERDAVEFKSFPVWRDQIDARIALCEDCLELEYEDEICQAELDHYHSRTTPFSTGSQKTTEPIVFDEVRLVRVPDTDDAWEVYVSCGGECVESTLTSSFDTAVAKVRGLIR
jgi:hypothetical protein